MAVKFINVGFGNHVAAARIVTVASPESAPIKRLVQDAREAGSVIDASCGRKTKSVLITDSRHVILSALSTEVISSRLNGEADPMQDQSRSYAESSRSYSGSAEEE